MSETGEYFVWGGGSIWPTQVSRHQQLVKLLKRWFQLQRTAAAVCFLPPSLPPTQSLYFMTTTMTTSNPFWPLYTRSWLSRKSHFTLLCSPRIGSFYVRPAYSFCLKAITPYFGCLLVVGGGGVFSSVVFIWRMTRPFTDAHPSELRRPVIIFFSIYIIIINGG